MKYFFQSEIFKQRVKKLWLQKYGVDNPLKIASIHKCGIDAAAKPDVRRRAQKTYRSHYDINPIQHALEVSRGVSNASQLPEAKEWLNTPKACLKRHNTMKNNGTYNKSKIEDVYYTRLCELHGIENIVRQITIASTRWAIDFYVKNIDTYIQFDGVYWHGLDRPIEIIAEGKTARDIQIYRKYLTDRIQDEWFKTMNLKLVRITDKQFLQNEW